MTPVIKITRKRLNEIRARGKKGLPLPEARGVSVSKGDQITLALIADSNQTHAATCIGSGLRGPRIALQT